MRQKRSSPKLALLTGATSGLGKELAQLLETKGIEVLKTGSSQHNLADRKERQELLKLISTKKPDLIINNAGFGLYGPCIDLSMDEQIDMIEVNVSALVEISIHSARVLASEGKEGKILNISSAGAFFPYPTFNVYCASKAFVNQFSLALDAELKSQGVRVLCACPGQIATHFRERASKGHPQKLDRRTMRVEQAAEHIWKQIIREKPLSIFDWRTRAMVTIARCLPRDFRGRFLANRLRERYS